MAGEEEATLLAARLRVGDEAEKRSLLARCRTWREAMEALREARPEPGPPLFELNLEEEHWPPS